MKKSILILLLFSFFTSLVFAQPDNKRLKQKDKVEKMKQNDKLESIKIGFITKELELTPEESQKFWPLYYEFEKKEKALREENSPKKPLAELSQKEMESLLDQRIALIDREAELKKDYLIRMKQVLPTQKILKLPMIENRFKRRLMDEVRGRKEKKSPRK